MFHVRGSEPEEAIQCLRRAISGDWTYWSISASDANLDPIRQRVEQLLDKIREEQRLLARQSLDNLGSTMKMLQGMRITTEVTESRRQLDEYEARYRQGTVFAYRSLLS